jgi:NAD(P)-dependent dehydrogenase (short-subunit alcohol dehydrogenase family)
MGERDMGVIDDLFSIRGKVAVVTGGSRGIGLMIAQAYVDAGARVYISSRKAEVCDEVAAELSKTGECVSIPADLATMEGVERLAGEIAAREPAVHILVNNAGAAWGAPMEEFPEDGFDKVWTLNVKGVFFLTVRLLPQLRSAATRDDPARVINIGSIDGIRVPDLQNYPYSAAKAGVHMLSRHMAHHLVKENVTVNAIAPGLFPSKMTQFLFSNVTDPEDIGWIPLGRAGRPDDIAGAAIFLASRASSYITGGVIPVDGGVATHG